MMTVEGLEHMGVRLATNNGKRLLSYATNCRLALTNTCFSTRNDGMSHSHNGTSPNNRKRIDYIPTCQSHRPGVHDASVAHSLTPQLRWAQTTTSCMSKSDSVVALYLADKHEHPENTESSTYDCYVLSKASSKIKLEGRFHSHPACPAP